MSYVTCIWNWHENSIFQTVWTCHQSYASVCYWLPHFCVQNYPLTAHYVPYSCQSQYLLNIFNFCDIWPSQHRSHVPLFDKFPFFCLVLELSMIWPNMINDQKVLLAFAPLLSSYVYSASGCHLRGILIVSTC